MKICLKAEIDLWKLFLHDQYDTGPLDEWAVADALNNFFAHSTFSEVKGQRDVERVEVRPPDDIGLSQFVIVVHTFSHPDAPMIFCDRKHTVEEIRQYLPAFVVESLDYLVDAEVDLSKKTFSSRKEEK